MQRQRASDAGVQRGVLQGGVVQGGGHSFRWPGQGLGQPVGAGGVDCGGQGGEHGQRIVFSAAWVPRSTIWATWP